MSEPFWLVWCPTGSRPPSRRHGNKEAAQQEAERLARCAPGQSFYVLKSLSVARKTDVTTIALCPEGERDPEFAEIPF